MQKLKLKLEDLRIDSFTTTAVQKEKGTIFGEQCTCNTNCTCPGCPTCYASCGGTCDATCNTCVASCYGTCDYTCNACGESADGTCQGQTAACTNCGGLYCW